MGAVLLIARTEIRRRSRSLAGLALIVALVAAVVLTALAGARRTETAFERLRDESVASDAWVQVDDPETADRVVAAIGDLPMVEDSAGWVISPSLPADAPSDTADFALIGDPFGRYSTAIDRPRLVEGRLPDPASTDEVLLSQTAARTFGRSSGDTMVVQTFSPDDLTSLVTGDEFPGFNGGPELADTAALAFPIYARPDPPGEITNLDQVQGVTVALAAFFVLLGAIGVTHALSVSVRRRRQDLGVLRVLGLARGQVRGSVRWQSVTIAVASAAIGIPLGLVVGRAVWNALVGDMGVVADPDQPWAVLLRVLPVSVALAPVAAWLPSRGAVRLSPSAALRAE